MSLDLQLFKKGFDIHKSRADKDAANIGVISKNEGAKIVLEKILKDISQNPMTKPSEIVVFIN